MPSFISSKSWVKDWTNKYNTCMLFYYNEIVKQLQEIHMNLAGEYNCIMDFDILMCQLTVWGHYYVEMGDNEFQDPNRILAVTSTIFNQNYCGHCPFHTKWIKVCLLSVWILCNLLLLSTFLNAIPVNNADLSENLCWIHLISRYFSQF